MKYKYKEISYLILLHIFQFISWAVAEDICTTTACQDAASVFMSRMDENIDPCDDFYKFACGQYVQNEFIPDSRTSVSIFQNIEDVVNDQLRKAFEEPLQNGDLHTTKLLKNLYQSCMNTEAIEARGIESLKETLTALGGWPMLKGDDWDENSFDWIEFGSKCRDLGYSSSYFIGWSVTIKMDGTSGCMISLDEPYLGLPHTFLMEDSETLKVYKEYIISVAEILGAPIVSRDEAVNQIIEFMQKLANISTRSEVQSEINNLCHPMTVRELSERYPRLPWKIYFKSILKDDMVLEDDDYVYICAPDYISSFIDIMNVIPRRVQANYAMWRLITESISYLNEEIRVKESEFMKKLTGRMNNEQRWKQCTDIVATFLPLGTSSLYIKRYFDEDAKLKVTDIVNNIKKGFKKNLQNITWMDENTRRNAIEKVDFVTANVSYYEEVLDERKVDGFYKTLTLSNTDFLKNILDCNKFYIRLRFSKPNSTISASYWKSYPKATNVNPYYSSLENTIILPAGLFQGEIFNSNRSQYLNYGAIGFLIGHELILGFDDQGRRVNKDGNQFDWWSPSTENEYVLKSQCIINQYSQYIDPEFNQTMNDVQTQRENIADNGAIKLAYSAYKDWQAENGEESVLPGMRYSTKQLFWISTASVFCSKFRPELLQTLSLTDDYSPNEIRINEMFSNTKEFAEDFQCREGSRMNPEKKCVVW